MKQLFSRWLLMVALVFGAATAMAQKSVLDENFANGKPEGWTTASSYWKFQDGSAVFEALVENGVDTLFTPMVSLAELDNKPSVALTYSNLANGDKLNTLKVLYRAATADEWSVLETFSEAADNQYWKGELPEGLTSVQVALAGAYLGGVNTPVYRLAIENKTEATEAPTGLKVEDLTTSSAMLWWDVCSSPKFKQYNLKVNSSKMTDMTATADIVDHVGWMITDEFYELTTSLRTKSIGSMFSMIAVMVTCLRGLRSPSRHLVSLSAERLLRISKEIYPRATRLSRTARLPRYRVNMRTIARGRSSPILLRVSTITSSCRSSAEKLRTIRFHLWLLRLTLVTPMPVRLRLAYVPRLTRRALLQ